MKKVFFFLFIVALLFVGFAAFTAQNEFCSEGMTLEVADDVETQVTVLIEFDHCADCIQSEFSANSRHNENELFHPVLDNRNEDKPKTLTRVNRNYMGQPRIGIS